MIDPSYAEPRELSPAERLLAAVIEQAIKDGCEKPFTFKKTKRKNRLVSQSRYIKELTQNYRCTSAREWFNAENSTLKHICSAIGVHVEYVRKLANQIFSEVDEQRKPRH